MYAYLVKKEELGNPFELLGGGGALRVNLVPANAGEGEEGLAVPIYVINADLAAQKDLMIDADKPVVLQVTDRMPVTGYKVLPVYVLPLVEEDHALSLEVQSSQGEEAEGQGDQAQNP